MAIQTFPYSLDSEGTLFFSLLEVGQPLAI